MSNGTHKDIVLGDKYSEPLTSEDQSKLLIFALLMLPTLLLGVGVIPAIFLGFGLYMMKKNQDFSSVEVAVRNFKICALIGVSIGVMIFFYNAFNYLNVKDSFWNSWNYKQTMWDGFWTSVVSYVYFFVVQYLFYKPLKSHNEWVVKNDIFSSKFKSSLIGKSESELNIIKGEKLKQYSVADELLKWAKLKEAGHITDEEFKEAREKLLKKS